MKNQSIEVSEKAARLDVFVASNCESISRAFAQKLIADGNITVNQKPSKANQKLNIGDRIEINIPDPEVLETKPEDIPIDVLYEDDHVLVINKPKGMVVHPASGNYSGTLVNALLGYCGDRLSDINGVIRPGIVHRIDKDTSGILLITKTNVSHEYFSELFKKHDITRVYYAIVEGIISENRGTIDAPIGRHPVDRKKMAVNIKTGKNAVTHFEVLNRMNGYTYIKARLETGRTHQIRVHLAYIGHALVGDSVYGKRKQVLMTDGQALHAGVLGFKHPETGEYMEFTCEPPKNFLGLLEELSK